MSTEATFEVRVPVPLLQFGIDQNEIECRVTEWLVLSSFSGSLSEYILRDMY